MSNKDYLSRKLKQATDSLETIDWQVDSELIGHDARHIVDDVKNAIRQITILDIDTLSDPYDVRSVYELLKRVRCSINIIRATVDTLEEHLDDSIEAVDAVRNHLDEHNDEDL